MIAKAIMPHILFIPDERGRNDCVSDFAGVDGADSHRVVGGIVVRASMSRRMNRSNLNFEDT
jgi:hypothetical protein